jgi:hypothetical protein
MLQGSRQHCAEWQCNAGVSWILQIGLLGQFMRSTSRQQRIKGSLQASLGSFFRSSLERLPALPLAGERAIACLPYAISGLTAPTGQRDFDRFHRLNYRFPRLNYCAGGWRAIAWTEALRPDPPGFSDLLLIGGRESVGQRLHEAHECVLFGVGEAEMPDFARVHIIRRFGGRPAARALARIVPRASW